MDRPLSNSVTLFVVATPIGNMADITQRAIETLNSVDLIFAEDTRRAAILLGRLGLSKPLQSLHQHNETQRLKQALGKLADGQNIAIISDAGTPLISDPGFELVAAARQQGYNVVPLPGANAAVTAISAAGLPADRFTFEGFLPAKNSARQQRLQQLRWETRLLVFYESPRRVVDSLQAMAEVFGAQRRACVAREITKLYETFHQGTLTSLAADFQANEQVCKGEMVILVEGGAQAAPPAVDAEALLRALIGEMPLKKAAKIVAEFTDASRNELYQLGLSWNSSDN